MSDTETGGTERMVLMVLAFHANDETGIAYPSVATIAECANISDQRFVRRVLQRLIASGKLRVVTAGGGRGKATEYEVLPQPETLVQETLVRVQETGVQETLVSDVNQGTYPGILSQKPGYPVPPHHLNKDQNTNTPPTPHADPGGAPPQNPEGGGIVAGIIQKIIGSAVDDRAEVRRLLEGAFVMPSSAARLARNPAVTAELVKRAIEHAYVSKLGPGGIVSMLDDPESLDQLDPHRGRRMERERQVAAWNREADESEREHAAQLARIDQARAKLAEMPLDGRTALVRECFDAMPPLAQQMNLIDGRIPDDPLAKPWGALTLAILERLGSVPVQAPAGKLLNV